MLVQTEDLVLIPFILTEVDFINFAERGLTDFFYMHPILEPAFLTTTANPEPTQLKFFQTLQQADNFSPVRLAFFLQA